jgi:hypothetical protein
MGLEEAIKGTMTEFRSRTRMWKMVTSRGDLSAEIKTGHTNLVKRIDDLFNPEIDSKNVLRDSRKSANRNLLSDLKIA